jgi:hypothetical protein
MSSSCLAARYLALRRVRGNLGAAARRAKISDNDRDEQNKRMNGRIVALDLKVDEIHKNTKPDRPDVGAKVADTFNAMGNAATGLANGIRLVQDGGNPQEAAAEFLRSSGAILKTVGQLAKLGGPYGKIAGEVLEALQGLCDFVATILNLSQKKEPEQTLSEVIRGELRDAFGQRKCDDLFGVLMNFEVMGDQAKQAFKEIRDGKKLPVKTWQDAVAEATALIGGGGEAMALNSARHWLEDDTNIESKYWLDVFELYILAQRKCLDTWQCALCLVDKEHDEELRIGFAGFKVYIDQQQDFIAAIAPVAVSKVMGFHIGGGRHDKTVYIRKGGFAAKAGAGVWKGAEGWNYDKVASSPGRLWLLSNGQVGTIPIDDEANAMYGLRGFNEYATDYFIDLCVVPRRPTDKEPNSGQVSEIHALRKIQPDNEPAAVYFFPWDEATSAQQAKDGWDKRKSVFGRRYKLAARLPVVKFTKIAASPDGYLYLWSAERQTLFYWDDKEIRPMAHPVGASLFALSASNDKLYILGPRQIAYKLHSDINATISEAAKGWTVVPAPPPAMNLPRDWCYKSVEETEGGALLVTICDDSNSTYGHFYKWADGKWVADPERGRYAGFQLGALPLRCHDTFNALKTAMQGLNEMEQTRPA